MSIDPNAALVVALTANTKALATLNTTMWALGAALTQNTEEEQQLMATIDNLTAVVTQITADDGALKTALDSVVAALVAAKAGGFTPAQQAALDAAVSQLTTAHAALQADAVEATSAVTPPPPGP